mgnify:FL=1
MIVGLPPDDIVVLSVLPPGPELDQPGLVVVVVVPIELEVVLLGDLLLLLLRVVETEEVVVEPKQSWRLFYIQLNSLQPSYLCLS